MVLQKFKAPTSQQKISFASLSLQNIIAHTRAVFSHTHKDYLSKNSLLLKIFFFYTKPEDVRHKWTEATSLLYRFFRSNKQLSCDFFAIPFLGSTFCRK